MKKQVLVGGIIIICGLFITLTSLRDFNIKSNRSGGEQAAQTYSAAQLQSLTIEASSTNVKLLPAEDDTISLKFYNSNNKSLDIATYVSSKLKGDDLTLEVSSTKKWFSLFDFTSETLEVAVPSELLEELTVESKSGNITGEDINVKDSISLEARSGNIKLEDSSSNELAVSVSSGNLSFEEVSTKYGELEATSGNIKLLSFTADELEVESTSGNITVFGDVASIDATVLSGNIDLDLIQLTADSKLISNSGNIKLVIEQAESLYVTHEKNSGSTSISKSGFELLKQGNNKTEGVFGKGDVKLNVKTKSGNFRLN